MAEVPAQATLNEAALKRFDPYVKEILDTAKYVALYTFKPEENEWEKTNVEGSLFVYSRTGEPFYNILVLNRLSTTNLIEPITHKIDLQLQEPFLLYRNTKFIIYGIWFYEKEECTRLAALIQELMKESGGSKRTPTSNTNGNCTVDLYKMLSQAQEAYNSTKSASNNVKNAANKVSLQEVDQTPQSVVEFFAKAGSAPQKVPPVPTVSGSRIVLARSQSLSSHETSDKAPLNPLIHQLMSNPVHSVEHIEKQQRSVTPQSGEPSSSQVLKNFMRPSSGHLLDVEPSASEETHKKSIKVENGLKGFNFLRISSPSFQSLLTQPLAETVEFRSPSASRASQPLIASVEFQNSTASRTGLDTPQKPALMPPAMFTPSVLKEATPERGYSYSGNDQPKPEPLTRNQLLQAINYLLKNDPDFMTKIHEAYVKSLTDKVL